MLIFELLRQRGLRAPDDDLSGGVPDADVPTGDDGPAIPSPAPDDDDTVDLSGIMDDLLDDDGAPKAEAAAEAGPERDESGRFKKRADDAEASDQADQEDESEQPAEAADDQADATPEHLAEWTDEQREALAKLPESVQQFLRDPQQLLQQIEGQIADQVRPFVEQWKPFQEAFAEPAVNAYLERRQADLKQPAHAIVANVLQADAFLTYSTNTAQKLAYAADLLRSYGLDPLDVATIHDPQFQRDFAQDDLQAQLSNERWQRQRMETQATHQSRGQLSERVAQFAAETGADGQPLRPLMRSEAVRATMGSLLQSGRATSLEDAYRMAAEPIEAEIESRSRARAAQQAKADAERRRQAVQKAARARPTRVNTNAQGTSKTNESLDDILNDVVSSAF